MQKFLPLHIVMSFFLTHLFLFLQSLSVLCSVGSFHCSLYMEPRVYSDGDLILSGFFPLDSKNFDLDIHQIFYVLKEHRQTLGGFINHYDYALTFLYAIEEINKDTNLLPNLTLGFNIYNALNNYGEPLENTLIWFSGVNQPVPNYNCEKKKKSVGVITATEPQFSSTIGSLLELYRIPQVTYAPFNTLLNNKDNFPSLYQMSTKDISLAHGVMWLLLNFDWTWVGVISVNIKNKQFLKELERDMLKKRICLLFIMALHASGISKVELKPSLGVSYPTRKPNVTIVYGDADIFVGMSIIARASELSGMMWIMATDAYINLQKMKSLMGFSHGSLSFTPQKRDIPGFKDFIKTVNPSKYPEDIYLVKFWFETFNCSFPGSLCGKVQVCPPNTSLEFMPGNTDMMVMSESSYLIYNAVHAVSRALHEMLLEETETELAVDANTAVLSWQLHPFLRSIQFTNSIGEHISLDEQKNFKRSYTILNILSFRENSDFLLKVGEFVFNGPNNQTFLISEETIEWPVGLKKTPQSSCHQSCGLGFKRSAVDISTMQENTLDKNRLCCFECVFCPEGEISNQKGAEACSQCSDQEYSNQERTSCLPKLVTYLAFEDFLGMILSSTVLCFSVLTGGVLWIFVKNKDTPIVKANNRTLSYILLISLLLCFLCSLLFIGRPNTVTCILQQVTFAVVFTVAVSTVLAKTITVLLAFNSMKLGRTMRWLLVSGASNYVILICTVIQVIICGIWLGLSPPFVDIDTHSEPRHLFIVCNKGSVTAFYCVLGYLGFMALVSFFLSYLVRNLPDTFNEAKFLTFSMLVFCSIWVTFLPVYHSAQGKVMVALEIFSIVSSSAGLLVCIFAPKCYIILIRPDKNSLKNVRKKISPWKNEHS